MSLPFPRRPLVLGTWLVIYNPRHLAELNETGETRTNLIDTLLTFTLICLAPSPWHSAMGRG